MKVYIDNDYKCHAHPGDGLIPVESEFFDEKCEAFIAGYRFVPAGETWTRSDGLMIHGEMLSPLSDYKKIEAVQRAYERAAFADMKPMIAANAGDYVAAYEEGVQSA